MNQYENLMAEWRNSRPEYSQFCDDGILVQEKWDATQPKIAFLLKESNDNFVNIRGRGYGPHGNSRLFWRNLRIWRYIIRCHFAGSNPTLDQARIEKEQPLDDVAYINIKKNCECRRVSNDQDIAFYVKKDWDYLQQQIEIINPDVVVCCGTMKYLKDRLQICPKNGSIYTSGRRMVIDCAHPSAPRGYRKGFDRLSNDLVVRPFAKKTCRYSEWVLQTERRVSGRSSRSRIE